MGYRHARRRNSTSTKQLNFSASDEAAATADESAIPAGCVALPALIPDNVWKILVSPNDTVTEGDPLVILESMKMEVTVSATRAGTIREIRCAEGRPVAAGETLGVLAGCSPFR